MSVVDVEADRAEIAKMQHVLSGTNLGKVLFATSLEAPMISFRGDKTITAAFACRVGDKVDEAKAWVRNVETALHEFITRRCFLDCPPEEATARCAQFRSLGRGWFIVQLFMKGQKMKYWFENIERIERNRVDEIQQLGLGDSYIHFTRGFTCHTEVVFLVRGIMHPDQMSTQGAPSIAIKKWDPRYQGSLWANDEWIQQEMHAPLPTEQERRDRALSTFAAAERNRKKREKQKQKKAAEKQAATEAVLDDEESAAAAAQDFEQLLADMKLGKDAPG
tara:strand:+ start:1824 stop:2654 length:831 start_codon:yes stop_codon:yes gene_type:complete